MSDQKKYYVVYRVDPQPEGLTEERLLEEYGNDIGACDGVIIHSIIGTPGGPGPLSHMLATYDGIKQAPMTLQQQFQIWALWAQGLTESLPKGDGRRTITSWVHETVKGVLQEKMKEEQGGEET